jgi:hypothetical protein
MAQMPIQMVAGRAQSYLPPTPSNMPPVAPAKASAQATAQLPARPPSTAQAVDLGAISPKTLRPGSIDQVTFRERMAALNRADPSPFAPAATTPPQVPAQSPLALPPAAKAAPSIPTLTPAQLAALGLDVSALTVEPPLSAADAAPASAATDATAALAAPAEAAPLAPADLDAAASASAAPAADPATPSAMPGTAAQDAEARANAPMPGARLGQDGVWELPRQPGKDEREWLAGMNAKWRIVENPDSVRLFLGADGKFGFDDLLDIINPLQHIPLVNLAYRKLTGDTIDGAAQLLGAIPFGPLSVASSLTDLAFRSETGAGLAENGLAMLFGPGQSEPGAEEIATAAGRTTQLSEVPQIRRGSNR